MLVMFTEASTKVPMTLEASCIIAVRRPPAQGGQGVVMETHVLTTMMGPQGNMAFASTDSVEEISRRVNLARVIKDGEPFDATLLGFPAN